MSAQPFDATSDALARIESGWADIVSLHPDVEPDVVFVVKSDKRAWGHMTLGRSWQESLPEGTAGPTRRWREIMLSAELLAQHPVRILQTMIHEAAHTVAQTRGVKDTSRQYRYHNGTFRAIAEEMGLEWAHVVPETVRIDGEVCLITDEDDNTHDEHGDPLFPVEARPDSTIGFSDMTITRETAELYADTLASLDLIKIKHHAERVGIQAPRKRRTVCFVLNEAADETFEVSCRADAEAYLGPIPSTCEATGLDPIARIGTVVYKGLVDRELLAPHIYWTEEV